MNPSPTSSPINLDDAKFVEFARQVLTTAGKTDLEARADELAGCMQEAAEDWIKEAEDTEEDTDDSD